jgi:hypothetical protein
MLNCSSSSLDDAGCFQPNFSNIIIQNSHGNKNILSRTLVGAFLEKADTYLEIHSH